MHRSGHQGLGSSFVGELGNTDQTPHLANKERGMSDVCRHLEFLQMQERNRSIQYHHTQYACIWQALLCI